MSSSSSSSSTSSPFARSLPSPVRLMVRALAVVATLALLRAASSPFPRELDGLGPRLEYHRQLLLHMAGLQADWDVAALNAAYFKHFKATGQSLPDMTDKPHAYHLSPLEELFPTQDPDWREKLQDRVSRGVPVVVRGAMYADAKNFPQAREWTIDFLKEKVFPKGTMIPVFTDTMNDRSVITQEFSAYVDGLRNTSRRWYARCLDDSRKVILSGFNASHLAHLMGKTHEHHATNSLNAGQGYCIFVGSSQVSTRMHCDTTTSAFMMMQGRKRWILFPPANSMLAVPVAHEMNVAYNSRVNMFAPKEDILREYPFMALARGYEVVIEQGDLLFFSSFNWHAVQNLDPVTIGVDFPVFDPIASFPRNTPLMLGTYLNMRAAFKVVSGFATGNQGLKQTFFQGYNLDEKEAERIKRANGVA